MTERERHLRYSLVHSTGEVLGNECRGSSIRHLSAETSNHTAPSSFCNKLPVTATLCIFSLFRTPHGTFTSHYTAHKPKRDQNTNNTKIHE